MLPSVFISRNIEKIDLFANKIKSHVGDIHAKSLIKFLLVEASELPKKGWLFFYSQTGVDFFLKQHSVKTILSYPNLRIATFGPATGQYLEKLGLEVHFKGNGIANETSQSFIKAWQPTLITFVRGRNSLHSLQHHLPDQITSTDMIVYDNLINTSCPLPYFDILVFTSPKNVEAFLGSNEFYEEQALIAIGPTTAKCLRDHNRNSVIIAKTPSMIGLGEAVLSLLPLSS